MTAPQAPAPPPEPGHVMSIAAWKRITAAHYQALAQLAAAESKQQ